MSQEKQANTTLLHTANISRMDFEKRLVADFSESGFFINYTKENNKTIALYYVQGESVPLHIATHRSGVALIYENYYTEYRGYNT